jgi:hypothetical protein
LGQKLTRRTTCPLLTLRTVTQLGVKPGVIHPGLEQQVRRSSGRVKDAEQQVGQSKRLASPLSFFRCDTKRLLTVVAQREPGLRLNRRPPSDGRAKFWLEMAPYQEKTL